MQTVCSLPEHFNYATTRGERLEVLCEDCGTAVSWDSYSRDFAAEEYPELPIKLVCIACYTQYEIASVEQAHDLHNY